MKFCMVTTFYPPYNFGGDGIFIYRLSNELGRRDHQVDVIHCQDAYLLLQPSGPKGNYPNHPNVNVHGLKSSAGWVSPLITQQTGSPGLKKTSLRTMLEGNRYDVIHFHNMSLMGITALQYGNAIKLYTTHEHWLVCPMHVLWKCNRELCVQKNCIRCAFAFRRPPQLWRYSSLLPRMLKHIDHFISPSRFTKRKHHELGLDIPILHIPYFLPKQETLDHLPAEEREPKAGQPYFLFVGRLEKIKGVQNLMPIFRQRPDYTLLIAGTGEYESSLRQLTGDAPNIKFLGRLDHAQLVDLYQGATAVIVPSICYEVFGIIIIESFATKTPVIVNNLGALPEVVQDSGGGFIYNNPGELLSAMDALANTPNLRDELGAKGYEAYLKFWTEDYHLTTYFDLIHSLKEQKKVVA